ELKSIAMKSFFDLLCVILAIFAYTQADDKEFLANECRIDDKVYKIHETFTKPGECLLYTCRGSNGLSAVTCPMEQVLPPCKFTAQDDTKTYPECCPKIKC
ncbi:hypothetical protein DOY81_006513, partial [Sarcophaga bullata]